MQGEREAEDGVVIRVVPERVGGEEGSVEKFERLRDEWREATWHWSSVAERCMHYAYQRIIGMGRLAVPFILSELEKELDDWFWALESITEARPPLAEEDYGDLEAMRDAWLQWAQDSGLLE